LAEPFIGGGRAVGESKLFAHHPGCRVSLGIVDQHMSDAYLTKANYGFDSVGFNVIAEWRP
jgi:hypothetical protein